MVTLQVPTSLSVDVMRRSASAVHTGADGRLLEDIQLVTQLLDVGQVFCQKQQSGVADFCQEVKRITQSRTHLHLGGKRLLSWQQLPPQTLLTIPVHFGSTSYGTLCIMHDAIQTELPSLSLPIAQLLAQACGWLLHTFEQSAFLQERGRQFEYQVQGQLTMREREVLQLMYRGYNREEIANELSIAPATLRKHRQHIYEQLGVHNEHDAVMAAYHSGLLSPFGDPLL